LSTIHRKGQALGWGSFATVFKGWDELLDRQVAIKELIPPFARHEAFVRTYLGQALRMVDLAHPNVLAIYGVEANRNPPALTREIAGETLGHQLLEGPIPVESALRAFRHALSGLGAIHARDLLHGAVKPENLFVCGEIYKIGDFGIRPFEGVPQFPSRFLKYAAPEVQSAEEDLGPSSDLYSLGVVMHELLLGSIRLEKLVEESLRLDEDPDDVADVGRESDRIWELFHRSPAPLPSLHEVESTIPVALSLVLRKMASKNPAERYGNAREVLAALGTANLTENLDATLSMTLVAKSTPPSPARRGRSLLWLASGVVSALVLASTALIVGVRQRGDEPALTTSLEAGRAAAEAQRDWLLRAARSAQGLSIALDPPHPGNRIPVETSLRFKVFSSRSAYLVILVLSSNGDWTCLYPAPGGEAIRIGAGKSLTLPLEQDRLAGFDPSASEPLGRDVYFALASERLPPPLPVGDADLWTTTYRPTADSAPDFADWIKRHLEDAGAAVAAHEVEVVGPP
jgi:serine/threonine protein kinase